MTHAERIAAIRAREAAATPGDWVWCGGKEARDIKLIGHKHWIVMDFVRQGMNGAQPRFLVGTMLEKALNLLTPRKGQEHHWKWNSDVDHPDAQFIAHARSDIPYLLARVETLEAALGEALEYVGRWTHQEAHDRLTAIKEGRDE